ncbi:MAG: Flp family type IVb pilin [Steroidobacteraceae bacterium]
MIVQAQYLKTWLCLWLGLKEDSRAVTALEYGMIAALIAAVIVGVVATLGTQLNAAFNTVSGKL